MGDVTKKVRFEADASGLGQEIERISSIGSALYETLKKEAQAYSDDLQKQSIYIEKNITLEKKRLEQAIQFEKLSAQERRDAALDKAKTPGEEKRIKKDYEDEIRRIDRSFLSAKMEQLDASRLLNLEYEDPIKKRPNLQESVMLEQGKSAAVMAGRTAMTLTKTMAGAMGLGIAFGIGGVLHSMVEGAVQLEKSSKSLNATMKDLDTSMLSGAENIGKTKIEMLEFTKEVSIATGGIYGKRTGEISLYTSQFAKAFGLEESLLLSVLPQGRMTRSDMSLEINNLLKELLSVNIISKNNFALLGEKIDFWSRLNDMQSKQMLTISPFRSAMALSAVGSTNLPILSDQRQIEFLQGMNEAIRNPKNEFMSAFVMNALNTGDLVSTLIRKEQGIFGENNVKDILNSLKQNYGQDPTRMTLAVQSFFNTNMSTAKMLVEKLFNEDETFKKFTNAFDKISEYSIQFENAKTDKEKQEILKRAETFDKDLLGVKHVGLLAMQNTAFTDVLSAQLKNLSSDLGTPILKELYKTFGDKKFQESLKDIAGALSFAAAEMLKYAAPIFKEAVELFSETVKWLSKFVGRDLQGIYKTDVYDVEKKLRTEEDPVVRERVSKQLEEIKKKVKNAIGTKNEQQVLDEAIRDLIFIWDEPGSLKKTPKQMLKESAEGKNPFEIDYGTRKGSEEASLILPKEIGEDLLQAIVSLDKTMLLHSDRVKRLDEKDFLRRPFVETQTGYLYVG